MITINNIESLDQTQPDRFNLVEYKNGDQILFAIKKYMFKYELEYIYANQVVSQTTFSKLSLLFTYYLESLKLNKNIKFRNIRIAVNYNRSKYYCGRLQKLLSDDKSIDPSATITALKLTSIDAVKLLIEFQKQYKEYIDILLKQDLSNSTQE